MSGRDAKFESFGEFFNRRGYELLELMERLKKSENPDDLRQFHKLHKMNVPEFVKMIEDEWDEYCYCADDPAPSVPSIAVRTVH